MIEINNIINECCFAIQYCKKKSNFRKIRLILDLKNFHQKLKKTFFRAFNQRVLQGIKKHLRMVIWMQKFIKFHLPHYEIPQLSSL